MLIAFHSSPYSAPLQTGTPNRGFELNVDILFTDSDSYDFVKAPKCEFHINASSPGEQTTTNSCERKKKKKNFSSHEKLINSTVCFSSLEVHTSCLHSKDECFTRLSRCHLSFASRNNTLKEPRREAFRSNKFSI